VVHRDCDVCAGSVETISEPFDFSVTDSKEAVAALNKLYKICARVCGGKDEHFVGMVQNVTNQSIAAAPPGKGNTPGTCLFMKMSKGDPVRGWTQPDSGRVLAHELTHNYGLNHLTTNSVLCSFGGGVGNNLDPYKYDPCFIGSANENDPATTFGFDPISLQAIAPTNAADYMSYVNDRGAWVSDQTWTNLLRRFPPLSKVTGQSLAAGPSPGFDGSALLVEGRIQPGTAAGFLKPSFHVPAGGFDLRSLVEAGTSDTTYRLRLSDPQGKILLESPVNLLETDSHEPEANSVEAFVELIPFHPETRHLELLNGNQVIASQVVSAHAPSISLAVPVVNEPQHTLQLNWTAADEDGDSLVFLVQYSANDGATWQGLRLDYPDLSLTVDTRSLTGSTQARVRVIASDGINSTVATSDRFALAKHAPEIFIGGVQEDERLAFGSAANLIGVAVDAEDGKLSGERIVWQIAGGTPSNGTGGEIPLANLAPGSYVATFTATDVDQMIGSATRRFEILALTVPYGLAPELDGECSDASYENAVSVRIPLADGSSASASVLYADGYLYVCFNDLKFSTSLMLPARVGVQFNLTGNGNMSAQTDDVGFFVNEAGIPLQSVGNGRELASTLSPKPGFTALVNRGNGAWSAELQIADSLLGGWNHAARIMLTHEVPALISASGVWPVTAAVTQSTTWAQAYLGIPPAPNNRPPVAHAGGSRTFSLGAPQSIPLDGTGSYDPDGDALLFAWSQVAGPSVKLDNANSATPSFIIAPPIANTLLRFRLIVSDSRLASAPVENEINLLPAIKQPAPAPTESKFNSDGTFVSRLQVAAGTPGDRFRVEASADLVHWVSISTNQLDLNLRIYLSDPDAKNFRQRFYRARQ
ncbi:MAG: hypothetical protein HY043_17550, partial [Verrucomicrobia bacterium]|nr:hypothetical protein [Verrucomicrobiota bacterium]